MLRTVFCNLGLDLSISCYVDFNWLNCYLDHLVNNLPGGTGNEACSWESWDFLRFSKSMLMCGAWWEPGLWWECNPIGSCRLRPCGLCMCEGRCAGCATKCCLKNSTVKQNITIWQLNQIWLDAKLAAVLNLPSEVLRHAKALKATDRVMSWRFQYPYKIAGNSRIIIIGFWHDVYLYALVKRKNKFFLNRYKFIDIREISLWYVATKGVCVVPWLMPIAHHFQYVFGNLHIKKLDWFGEKEICIITGLQISGHYPDGPAATLYALL